MNEIEKDFASFHGIHIWNQCSVCGHSFHLGETHLKYVHMISVSDKAIIVKPIAVCSKECQYA